jgi:putative mycofactocin binding protein MftB
VGAQVVLRRERFGALAYDLSTKRLLVLSDPDLITVLENLDESANADTAVAAVAPAKQAALLAALARLQRDGLIRVA